MVIKTTFSSVFTFCFLFLASVFHYSNASPSQERGLFQSKYFSVQDYNASPYNWSIVQDHRGVFYIANVGGVLVYDGLNWDLINTSNETAVRSLAVDSNDHVYVGGYNDLGVLVPDSKGRLNFKSLVPLIDDRNNKFNDVWDIVCVNDTVYFLTTNYLFKYTKDTIKQIQSAGKGFYMNHVIGGEHYVQDLGIGLMSFTGDSLSLIQGGSYFADIPIRQVFQTDKGLLICSRNDGLFLYNFKEGKHVIESLAEISANGGRLSSYFTQHSYYHGTQISDDRLVLSSITGDILVVDQDFAVIDVINHQTIGSKAITNYVYYSDNQTLWLALDNGLCVVEVSSPFRFWNEAMGVNGVITDVARLRDTLYVSTISGVFFSPPLGEDKFDLNYFYPVEGKFEQSWEFLYFEPTGTGVITKEEIQKIEDSVTLLVATRNGLFSISGGKSQRISDYDILFKLYQSKQEPHRLILGLLDGVAVLSKKSDGWIDHGLMYGINERINSIAEDSLGRLWLASDFKGIYRVKNPFADNPDSIRVDFFDTNHGLHSNKAILIFDDYQEIVYIVDGTLYTFDNDNELFQSIGFEEFFAKYATSDRNESDSLSWLRVNPDVISQFYITHIHDTIIWFSTNQGVFRYKKGAERDFFNIPSALISKVTTSDSVLFYGTNIATTHLQTESDSLFYSINPESKVNLGTVLPFSHNSLTFHYTIPFIEGGKNILFSFLLKGYDKDWSEWSPETKKEYTNLREGKYVFIVKAKNQYGIESYPAEFSFTIKAPWYRTYLAYAGYIILGALFVVLVVFLYTKRLIKEKENLESLVKERTQEILMQKEEILVQSEHLKEANEWIKAKNRVLEEQKKEIEHQNDELELSNATKNKFFSIIAHDLRNHISTFVNTTGHILADIENIDRKTTKKYIECLNSLSLTTYNLLENLLDWASSQMGGIEYNPAALDLRSLVIQNVELAKGELDAKQINLKIDVPEEIFVYADENMLLTVIRNLISNAIKFTYEKGNIKITANSDEKYCYLSVIDNGIGISKENLSNLFRIDKDVRTVGTNDERGSGLGLLLCMEFVEFNGGTIEVKSEPQEGSTFTIKLNTATD